MEIKKIVEMLENKTEIDEPITGIGIVSWDTKSWSMIFLWEFNFDNQAFEESIHCELKQIWYNRFAVQIKVPSLELIVDNGLIRPMREGDSVGKSNLVISYLREAELWIPEYMDDYIIEAYYLDPRWEWKPHRWSNGELCYGRRETSVTPFHINGDSQIGFVCELPLK